MKYPLHHALMPSANATSDIYYRPRQRMHRIPELFPLSNDGRFLGKKLIENNIQRLPGAPVTLYAAELFDAAETMARSASVPTALDNPISTICVKPRREQDLPGMEKLLAKAGGLRA